MLALPEQGQDKPVVRGPAASKIAKTGGSTADETTAAPVLGVVLFVASHELFALVTGENIHCCPALLRRPLAAAGVRRPVAVRGSADGRTDDKREQPGVRRDLSSVSGLQPPLQFSPSRLLDPRPIARDRSGVVVVVTVLSVPFQGIYCIAVA